jgi:branched-chain amino acid transport system ATP-binding protein
MSDLLLSLHDVSAAYGNVQVLDRVNVAVEKGKIVCLLGPNGAGKSSLIKAILGLVKVTRGAITFAGQEITGKKTHQIIQTGIAIVPEGKRIFPKMTTLENLRMGAFMVDDRRVIAERMERVFQLFPRLKERGHQIAGTMSGGEQSMLSIGRGLMSSPQLMIFDEPSLGLAPLLVEQNFETIRQINQAGTTVFLVEQNASLTLEIAAYGYVLQKGEVVAQGTAQELARSEVIQSAYLKI